MFENLFDGLVSVLTLGHIGIIFVGVFIGNLLGVLPGIGALAAVAMLLPVTYGMDSTLAIMMLAGIYYGTGFGGAITSILLRIPGTPAHAVVCLDGYPLGQKGRGGSAIFMAIFASLVGVIVGIMIMAFFSPMIAELAIKFGPIDYFLLMTLGLIAAATISAGAPLRALAAVIIGLLLGCVGTDINTGAWRFTGGVPNLADGVSLVALALALFGISDMLLEAKKIEVVEELNKKKENKLNQGWRSIYPSKEEFNRSRGPIVRGSLIGSFFGALPGTGGTLASFMSYALEKRVSKRSGEFGHGAIEGVSGPESANSSAEITAFIPTLTLGIPGDAIMAIMIGALMIHDITPGPTLLIEHPELFWGLLASFWVGNIILVLLNIPLVGVWIKLLKVPFRFILPLVIILICIASYSGNNSLFDSWLALGLGAIAVFFRVLKIGMAPMLLGFILGPMMEENLRRAFIISDGSFMTFVDNPLSFGLSVVTFGILVIGMYSSRDKNKKINL